MQGCVGSEDGVQAVVEGRRALAVAEDQVAEGFVFGDEGFLFGNRVAGDVAFGDAAKCGERLPLGAGRAVGPVGEVGGEGVGDEDAVKERARIRSEKGIRWGGRPLNAAA
ncbi:hypothetical protein [Streptomyces atratus]|uniref:hypothetical protein n=1 Tax=Streptomyces atratus TaxID=1893 RepID=UPI003F542242